MLLSTMTLNNRNDLSCHHSHHPRAVADLKDIPILDFSITVWLPYPQNDARPKQKQNALVPVAVDGNSVSFIGDLVWAMTFPTVV